MLKRISLKGWKSIRDQSINLNPLTVAIGANGSGKSNLLSFIAMFADIFSSKPRMRSYVRTHGAANSLLYHGTRETQAIDLELTFGTSSGELKYATRWIPTLDGGLIFEDERIEVLHQDSLNDQETSLGSGHAESNLIRCAESGNSIARTCLRLLRSCKVFQFHNTPLRSDMRTPSYVDANGSLLSDANALASTLYLYRQNDSTTFRAITAVTQRIMPGFEQFILEPSKSDDTEIALKWKEANHDYEFGPHQLTDGVLRFITLLVLLLQPEEDQPKLIGLDGPEVGLHPRVLELLSDLVIAASNDVQVIVATQSSELLDYFDPSSVLVAERKGGATEFKNLDVKKLEPWLEKYSLGELWERNYFGGGLDS